LFCTGSNNKKAVRFYQIIHKRINNRRRVFAQTVYAKKYVVIFVEKLQSSTWYKIHRLTKNILILDGTHSIKYWPMFVGVTAKNTTIDCSGCACSIKNTGTQNSQIRRVRFDTWGSQFCNQHTQKVIRDFFAYKGITVSYDCRNRNTVKEAERGCRTCSLYNTL
jgi:hypothetical protein